MRPELQPVTVEISLAAPEIDFHDVEIDDRAGCIEILDKHKLLLHVPVQRRARKPGGYISLIAIDLCRTAGASRE